MSLKTCTLYCKYCDKHYPHYSSICEKNEKKCHPHDCPKRDKDCATHIYAHDLPYSITKPGKYVLCDSVVYTNQTFAAINILVSGVTLDGNGETIDLGGVGLQAVLGQNINDAVIENLIIRNGNLTTIDVITVPSAPPGVAVADLRAAAIKLTGSRNIIVKNVLIDRVLYGIAALNTISNITVTDSQINDFGIVTTISGVTQPVGAGIVVSGSSTNILAKDIQITNCHTASETGFDGVFLNLVNGFNVENSYAVAGRRTVPGINFGAFCATYSRSGLFKNNDARFATQPFFIFRSTGIDVVDSHVTDTNQDGVELTFCDNCAVRNLTIHRILDNPADVSPGSGVKLNACNNCVVEKCVATDFTIGNNPADNNGAGIVLAACNRCIVQDNIVNGNNFGVKEVLVAQLGPPPPLVGTPSAFYRNTAAFNTVNYLLGTPVPLVVDTTAAGINNTLVNPYVNIAPQLP